MLLQWHVVDFFERLDFLQLAECCRGNGLEAGEVTQGPGHNGLPVAVEATGVVPETRDLCITQRRQIGNTCTRKPKMKLERWTLQW